MIPYSRQHITEDDIQAVVEALRSELITQGPRIPAFEQDLSDKVGSKFAIAVNSATSALHLACLALGLGPGDYLWTSPNSFIASSNCALYCGAKVDFIDIDPKTYNLCPVALRKKLEQAKRKQTLPKIVVPVHFAGQPCEMETINMLAKEFGFFVIEDASHAIGASRSNSAVGNCKFSDITVFSFHAVKIITSAEGGLLTTNDQDLARRIFDLRSHSVTRDKNRMTDSNNGGWYYEQIGLGFNYRMTELQAALAHSQFKRLDALIERRHQIAETYNSELKELPLILPWQQKENYSSYHLYPIQVMDHAPKKRRALYEKLYSAGIFVNVHYIPIHLHPFYKKMGFNKGDYPVAEAYYEHALSIPIYYGLSDDEQLKVIHMLKEHLAR